jgi:hypothetical protein
MRDSPLGVIRFDASIWSEKTTGYSQASPWDRGKSEKISTADLGRHLASNG